jgi:hypothetical protein
MASKAYTLTNMYLVVSNLDGKGFKREVPRAALMKAIAEVTDLAHPVAMKQFLKGMHEIGIVEPIGAGNIWRIIEEETV